MGARVTDHSLKSPHMVTTSASISGGKVKVTLVAPFAPGFLNGI